VVASGALRGTDVIDIGRLGLPWLGVDPSAASAKAIRRVRRLLGGDSSSVHTFYSFQNAVGLVAAGEGVTLVPSLAMENLRTDGVDALDIPGLGMRRVALRHLARGRGAEPVLDTAIGLIREAAASFSYEASDT
jgi:DNA-binding transcriptional LysR family regulator